MRMDKLTSRFQQALGDAQSLAVGRDHNLIEPAHLLLALLDQQGGSTRPLLQQAGVNATVLRQRLGEALDKLPAVSGQEGSVSVGNELSRLLTFPNVLVTAHQAFLTREALSEIARVTTTNLLRYANQTPLIDGSVLVEQKGTPS